MDQRELPNEWIYTQLGKIVPYGKTKKCVLADVADDTWVLELEDVEKNSSRLVHRKTVQERPFKSTKNRFEKGNVLYGKLRPYLNKVVVADGSGVCTTEIIPLDAEPFVLNRYLFHWLKTRDFLNYVNEVSYGVNMPRLGTKDGAAAPFILAPLTEQKIITEKLDTLLAQVETTKARLERIPQILKRFRQSVLAAAVGGKLTEEWRSRNLADVPTAERLLRDIKRAKETWSEFNINHNEVDRVRKRVRKLVLDEFDAVGLPEGWAWSALEDVVLMVVDCHNKTAPYTDVGIPIVRTSNIRDGRFVWEKIRFVSEQTYSYWSRRCPPEPGDIVFTREAPMGEAAIIPEDKKICLGQRTMLIRPVRDHLSENYLLLVLLDPAFRKRSEEIAVGTGVKHYRVGDVSELRVPVPPMEEQTEIVRRVEQLFAHADTIEQQVNSALARVNNLTQSILAKAFRGELTEQWRRDNPELISGDNSAAALLARIQAERAATAKPMRRKAKT